MRASTATAVLDAAPPEGEAAERTILLVDSAELFLQLEQTLLQRKGHSFLRAHTAAEARAHLENQHVDLVIMDLSLPDSTGHELVTWMRGREETRSVGVLIVTARGQRADVDACMAAGCDAFLFKPVTRTALCDRVRDLLHVAARRYVRTLVRLQVDARNDGRFLFGQTLNLSAGGMLLQTPAELTSGERLDLRFFVPGDPSPISARGRVVRAVPGGHEQAFGIEFEGLSERDRARLDGFVDASVHGSDNEPA